MKSPLLHQSIVLHIINRIEFSYQLEISFFALEKQPEDTIHDQSNEPIYEKVNKTKMRTEEAMDLLVAFLLFIKN